MQDNPDTAFSLDAYDYSLPPGLIAQQPSPNRELSRLMVVDRKRGALTHRRFHELGDYLGPGDLLVVNDTRVVPARLHGSKETGGQIELLVLDPYKSPENGAKDGYECLIRSSKPARYGSTVLLDEGTRATILSDPGDGRVKVRFETPEPILSLLDRIGSIPLPPYIRRDSPAGSVAEVAEDARSYQTVYAASKGAVAAPTAGLHFTEELLDSLRGRGVETASVTLHVGYGTFAPMRVTDIRQHLIHTEYAELGPEAAARVRRARKEGRRVVAVGTTVVRTLEWAASRSPQLMPVSGLCSHYIYPGYTFRVVDALITNFHLPRSTLMLLVCAFAGREAILDAYRTAIGQGYRFFSYGDAMLLL